VILEACVETVDEARAADTGGAARIELCADLAEQGTTPAESTTAACVAAVRIPVFVMVRVRAGRFVYSGEELAAMCRQVARARSLGAAGIVTGALRPDGTIDADAVSALVDVADTLPVTFHRAFDATPDRAAALETLVTCGVVRVLTSGGAPTAEAGAAEIARLVRQAAGRLSVIAAGRVRADNVRNIVARTGVTEVHAHVTATPDVERLVQAIRRP
jgi:copper homeostasis protein